MAPPCFYLQSYQGDLQLRMGFDWRLKTRRRAGGLEPHESINTMPPCAATFDYLYFPPSQFSLQKQRFLAFRSALNQSPTNKSLPKWAKGISPNLFVFSSSSSPPHLRLRATTPPPSLAKMAQCKTHNTRPATSIKKSRCAVAKHNPALSPLIAVFRTGCA